MKEHLQSFTVKNLSSNSLFLELVKTLLEPNSSRNYLQKVVNLLKQYLSAKHVVLHTFVDNLIVCASDDLSYIQEKTLNNKIGNIENLQDNLNEKPYWSNKSYIFPLSVEGFIEISWDEKPLNSDLETYNSVFELLKYSLINRGKLICTEKSTLQDKSLANFSKILASEPDLKSQISQIAKEIALTLNASRCQIKVLTSDKKDENPIYDSQLSVEFVKEPNLEALSVIPAVEKQWLEEIKQKKTILLDFHGCGSEDNALEGIETLLSVQSILGFPLLYKDKVFSVLILHQCDYERVWKNEELDFLNQVVLLLSLLLGKEIEVNKKYEVITSDPNTGLINSDEFLRELNHILVRAQVKNSFFSLIMIDVEKLKDINLRMGFVAGNLVLSQTSRYLKRLYGDKYEIARYSNDEFVVIMEGIDQNQAQVEAGKIKDHLTNIIVLGIGPVEYNFSFVTYPTHAASVPELLTLLEQSMLISKSRGRLQISSYDDVKTYLKNDNGQLLLNRAIPEIILQKSNLKTGPEIFEAINKQILEQGQIKKYNADILDSIQSLALALDAKDSYTEGHSKRVSEYAYMLAKNIGLDLQEIEWIRLAAMMHDIGKIGIPENILCKPGKLTKEEYETMKKHSVIGARILKPIKPLEKVVDLVLSHHEYWDGSGYPNGLMKDQIPIGARIVSIVDAYQAMTSNRPYRSSLSIEEAFNRLIAGKEKQWDPDLVDLFIKLIS